MLKYSATFLPVDKSNEIGEDRLKESGRFPAQVSLIFDGLVTLLGFDWLVV